MNLTNEQIEIINSQGNIRINAVAGSGKTTTLIEYAKARQGKGSILYIAFNKSVKIEAEKKFALAGIVNVQVETAHSLAYSYIVSGSAYRVKKEGGYKTQQIIGILELDGFGQKNTEYIIANHINRYLTYFCNSSKAKVQELPYEDVLQDPKAKQFAINFRNEILQQTRLFLDKMNKGEIEITHDFYLKKFQLVNPQLGYDYILFDEGQDASEAMLDVFLHQKATKVIVGDTHQQIYGWRYAINSLEKMEWPSYTLSNSFRFDNEIASLATRILKWKDHYQTNEKVIINGYGDHHEVKTKAVLARTNTALLVKAIELIIEKKEVKKVYFEGRIETYTYADEGAYIYDILNLYQGKNHLVRDKLIGSLQSMEELEEYVEKTEDAQLSLMIEIVKKYGSRLPGYIKILKENHLENNNKEEAEMIFSTVHRCKGMEYDEITLTNDFITESKIIKTIQELGIENVQSNKLSEEINLLYVAITRTKNKLNIPVDLLPDSRIRPFISSTDTKSEERTYQQPIAGKRYSAGDAKKTSKEVHGPWNKEDDHRLTVLFYKKIPPKDMANMLGRTYSAIQLRVAQLELRMDE